MRTEDRKRLVWFGVVSKLMFIKSTVKQLRMVAKIILLLCPRDERGARGVPAACRTVSRRVERSRPAGRPERRLTIITTHKQRSLQCMPTAQLGRLDRCMHMHGCTQSCHAAHPLLGIKLLSVY